MPGPDLIASSSEPRTKKDRQRRERDVSMAELARDIISISEQESFHSDTNDQGGQTSDGAGSPDEAARHASFDLVIRPAPKSGRLRRSKIPAPKDAAEELADLVSDSELNATARLNRARTRATTVPGFGAAEARRQGDGARHARGCPAVPAKCLLAPLGVATVAACLAGCGSAAISTSSWLHLTLTAWRPRST